MVPGDVLDERYQLVALVSETGLSVVFRAVDRVLDRAVALKIVHAGDHQAAQRLAREARVLRELGHPAIVRLLGQGGLPDGRIYLVMEWLDGEDLSHRLRRGPLPVADAIALGVRIVEALQAAHSAAIIHRDLKPSNVFLPGGQAAAATLLDFGVAHLTEATVALTAPGTVVGTPAYMAPEQCRGHAVDARTDLFAVGALLYECITGVRLFGATSAAATMARILFESAPRASTVLPTIPLELDELIARLVAKDPAARPATTSDVLECLHGRSPAEPSQRAKGGLSDAERRVVSVILATPAPVDPARDTVVTVSAPGGGRSELNSLASQFGARVEPLRNGAFIAVVEGDASPRDLAFRAARLALRALAADRTLRIGIATGASDMVGEQPVGLLVERLTDLVQALTTAGIYLDATSGPILEGRFDLDESGPVVRLVAEYHVEEPRRLLGQRTPLGGRAAELDVLEASYRASVEDRALRVALVLGEPGSGKSRLLYELAHRLTGAEVWTAHATPLTENAPLGMVVTGIRRALDLVDRDASRALGPRLRRRLERTMAPALIDRTERALLELMSSDDRDLDHTQRALAPLGDAVKIAWQDWMVAEATHQPLVLILEDLHWCDAPSIATFEAAFPLLVDLPVFVIATARPQVLNRFPGLWPRASVQEIHLAALSPRVSRSLVAAALGSATSASIVDRVVDLAAGNPFFLEELIRHVASGAAHDTEGLPPTVIAMAQARLGGLPPFARRVLRAGSLFGQRFWTRGLEVVLDGDPELGTLGQTIDALIHRELITLHPTSSIAGTREVAFGHALLRDAAYETLTAVDRSAGHRLVARWLSQHADRPPIEIATHFEHGDEGHLAVPWYVRAADRALLAHDLPAVLDVTARGFAAGATGDAELALRLARVEANQWMGTDVEEGWREAMHLFELAAPGSPAWFRAIREASALSHRRGQPAPLLAWWSALAAVDLENGCLDIAIEAMASVAGNLLLAGQLHSSDARLTALLARVHAPSTGTATAGWLWSVVSLRCVLQGDLEGGLDAENRACAAFEASERLRHLLVDRCNSAFLRIELGDFATAETELRQVLHLGKRLALVEQVAHAQQNLGLALLSQGRWDEAEAELRASIAAYQSGRNVPMTRLSLVYFARLELDRGRPAMALVHTDAVAAFVGRDAVSRYADGVAALAHLALDAPTAALALSSRAHTESAAGEQLEGDLVIALAHAESLRACGQDEPGRALGAQARATVEQRAARLRHHATRQRYLDLPLHRRILAAL